MSELGKTGTGAALAAALAQHEEPADAEQMDLLGLPQPKTFEGQRALEVITARKAGRPPGAKNKRTQKTVDWLLSVYQDPRAVLLAIAQAPIEELCLQLGCKPMEALQEKRLAAIGVLPYVAQRQPLSVDLTERKIVYLNISDGAAQVDGASTDGIGISARVVDGALVTVTDPQGGETDGNA